MNRPYVPVNWSKNDPITLERIEDIDNTLEGIDQDLSSITPNFTTVKQILNLQNNNQAVFVQNNGLTTKNIYYLINNIDPNLKTLLFIGIDDQLLGHTREIPDNMELIIGDE